MPIILRTTLLLVASNLFIPFAAVYMKAPLNRDFIYAALCILGAIFFTFRSQVA